MRRVAAEARRVLLEMAAERFGVPVDQLRVREAVISVAADPSKQVTYGELIGGKRFHVALTRRRTSTRPPAWRKVKPVQDLKIVGQSLPRYDIPAKVDGSQEMGRGHDGAGHGPRAQREAAGGGGAGRLDRRGLRARPAGIRPGGEQGQLRRGGLRARGAGHPGGTAAQGRTGGSRTRAPFPASDDLFTYMRSAEPTSVRRPQVDGDPDAALAGAAKVIEAEYNVPFQGHTAIGPAHAMADPSDGQMTIYSNDMKSYGMRNGIAEFLEMPRDQVRVVWMEGPQGYGRTAADDAGFEAAFLAKELGRPVRMQWMRDEETAWDTKGPAYALRLRGGLDADGNVVGWDYDARAADYNHVGYNEPDTVLIAQLSGVGRTKPASGRVSTPSDMYAIPNRRTAGAGGQPAAGLRDAAADGQPAGSQRSAGDLRRRVVHRRAGGGGQRRSGGVPPAAARRGARRRQRLPAGALDRGGEGGGGSLRMGRASVAEAARRRRRPHRTRHRLQLPRTRRSSRRSPRWR